MKKIITLICMIIISALGINLNVRNAHYNRMKFPWAVGDSGKVFRFDKDSNIVKITNLNPEYNLSDISFADTMIGFIIGNKLDKYSNWHGAIWKTEDNGKNWYVQRPALHKLTSFLDIKAFNRYCVWIRCGNNYSLITRDGGISWLVTSKPIQFPIK